MLDSTLLALSGLAGLHYAATAYVAAQAKKRSITTAQGEKLVAVGHVSSLHIYPVKSLGRMDVKSVICAHMGVCLPEHNVFDRHYMVVKENGAMATMREFGRMALISPRVVNGVLRLEAPGVAPLSLPTKVKKTNSSVVTVNIYGHDTRGLDCGPVASTWLSSVLGRNNMRLLYFASDLNERPARHGVPETARLAFPDAAPHHLMTQATVDLLNTQLAAPVSVHHFRPNLVVSGCAPHAEDNWDKLFIGNAIFRCSVLNPRCALTTTNPTTGMKDPNLEPLKTLRSYRPIYTRMPDSKAPLLGVYMVMEKPGKVRVGDTVFASFK